MSYQFKRIEYSGFRGTAAAGPQATESRTATRKNISLWNGGNGHEWDGSQGYQQHKNKSAPKRPRKSLGKEWAVAYPDIAARWHPVLNGKLKPQDVYMYSNKKVWWLGHCGHEWEANIYHQLNGLRCPYCAGKRVIRGKTDLATLYPSTAAEWHPTKNGELTPQDVTAHSERSVWWLCKKGHEWRATINNRISRNCPYCTHKSVVTGETDLATLYPDVAAEWHPIKNDDLEPNMVTAFSRRRVWWQCEKGHEWQVPVYWRTAGNKCPTCERMVLVKGKTDFASVYPDLLYLWHPTKNGDLTPENISAHSKKRVWWRCKSGHEWEAAVLNIGRGHSCPFCAGQRARKGETDLETLFPAVAAEWHPILNESLTPRDVTAHSGKAVWWQCAKDSDHVWKTKVYQRTNGNNPTGCPFCAGIRVVKGKTDLATLYPNIAAQWHPTKNGDLRPDMVTAHSNKKVWWQCDAGHEWSTAAKNRTKAKGTGCRKCYSEERKKKCGS